MRYHGREGRVYMSASGTTEAVSVANLTAWTLDMPRDRVDVTAFGDANKVYVAGLKDITGTLSGFWDDTSDALYDGAESSDGVLFYLYPSANVLTKYFYGPAWVDMAIAVGVSDAVSISGNFGAKGAWGQM
jgi:hypothetical protein